MAESDRRGSSLVAEFRSPAEARAAIEALEHHGIDGLEIAVASDAPEIRRPRADRRTLVHIGGRAGRGILLGALVGAVLFAVVGVVFLVVGWPLGAAAAIVLAGAAIGGTTGGFIGIERGVGMSEGWEQTFHEPDAVTVPVEVHAPTAGEMARAREVLGDRRPISLHEVSGSLHEVSGSLHEVSGSLHEVSGSLREVSGSESRR